MINTFKYLINILKCLFGFHSFIMTTVEIPWTKLYRKRQCVHCGKVDYASLGFSNALCQWIECGHPHHPFGGPIDFDRPSKYRKVHE